jgi:hypothetical protein
LVLLSRDMNYSIDLAKLSMLLPDNEDRIQFSGMLFF